MSEVFIGIDLGGTNIKVGCFDINMKLLAKESAPTQGDMGPEVVVQRISEVCQRVLKKIDLGPENLKRAGIGSPGPVNLKEGLVVAAPNLPLFRNVPMRDMVNEKLGCPVELENDANAAAWAEHVMGAAKGVREMVFFTLGTGIGGGVISNGQIVHGHRDDAAELGHIIIFPETGRTCGCGQQGCAEAYASAKSTVARATEEIEAGAFSSLQKVYKEKGEISCKDIFEHSARGDKIATRITDGTAKVLGLLCVNMLHTTGPQRIVFSGGMIAAGDMLLNRIQHYFRKFIWPMKEEPLEICFATLGEDSGIIGTAALALKAYKEGHNS